MGTYYSLGVTKNFWAESNKELSLSEWEAILHDRLDLECFTLMHNKNKLDGNLHEPIFEKNIDDFYDVLREILGENRNGNIDFYRSEFGTDINDYHIKYAEIQYKNKAGLDILIKFNFAMLFLEGKVIVEEFYTEPALLNWLFRNSNINNKLAGCIISNVGG